MDFNKIVDIVKLCLTKKYVDFKSRGSRSEFWYLQLFLIIALNLISFIFGSIGLPMILLLIVNIALYIPSLSAGVRRLHDINKSGWWLLIGLIPLVGLIVLIYFWVQKSDEGSNNFGTLD